MAMIARILHRCSVFSANKGKYITNRTHYRVTRREKSAYTTRIRRTLDRE